MSIISFRLQPVTTISEGDTFKIQKFWDENTDFYFHYQNTFNACGPASVQIVLDFYDIYQLPSQENLAIEMNTTLYQYTFADKMSNPFNTRNI